VLAGQQATGQGVVGNHRQPFLGAERQQVALEAAEQQVVARLHRGEGGQVPGLAAPEGARHLGGRPVGDADVAGLARLRHPVERLQRFVQGRVGVVGVELVEVDVVGAQPAQRGLDRVEDVPARHALVPGLRPHPADALGGDDEVVAAALQPAAQDLLGAAGGADVPAEGIDVGRVQEVDAGLGGGVEDGPAVRLVALQAEGHGAQAELRDLQAGAAEPRVLHGVSPAVGGGFTATIGKGSGEGPCGFGAAAPPPGGASVR